LVRLGRRAIRQGLGVGARTAIRPRASRTSPSSRALIWLGTQTSTAISAVSQGKGASRRAIVSGIGGRRQDGRRLITVLTAFLDSDATNAAERDRLEREASAIVDDQAARLAAAGSSLTEAVGRFVAARGPFLAELSGLGRSRSLDPTRLAALYGDASALLDRLLLRFIATHQRSATD